MKDQEFIVQNIRSQYTENPHTELDMLKALDTKVKKPANVFAYAYGSVSAVVMGAGMSLVMTDVSETVGIQNPMVCGIVIGIAGILLICIAYPAYLQVVKKERKKIAPEILRLTDELMK